MSKSPLVRPPSGATPVPSRPSLPTYPCSVSVVSRASWLLFTGVRVRCAVFCVLGVLGLLAPVHRCASAVCCVVCAVSWATRLLFSGVLVWRVVWCARCPGPRDSCSPVCTLSVRCFVHAVLGLLAPIHRCAVAVCCAVCAVSWATWLLFSRVLVRRVVWCVWCTGPPGSCSPVCRLVVRCFVSGVLGLLAPAGRCACVVCCVVCAVSWATWLPFTAVPLWHVLCCLCGVLGLVAPVHRCAVCLFAVLCVVCRVLGHVAPVHQCACLVCCVVCVVWVWVCARMCNTVLAAFFRRAQG